MRRLLGVAAAALLAAACGLPFGLGLPSTTQLINGADDELAKASAFEMAGRFTTGSDSIQLDVQLTAPSTVQMTVTVSSIQREVIQIGGKVYNRGKDYVPTLLGTDTNGTALAHAVGSHWFTSKDAIPLDTSGFTVTSKLKTQFLSALTYNRKDNVSADGVDTAELSGSASILNITESSPYRLVRLRTAQGQTVSDVTNLDFVFTNYNKNFGTQAPTNVFDLDDPTTWPPYYFAESISISNGGCTHSSCWSGGPCSTPSDCQAKAMGWRSATLLSSVLKNHGGTTGASAPSPRSALRSARPTSRSRGPSRCPTSPRSRC